MALSANDNILDSCVTALVQAKSTQLQSVAELKRHLHSQFAIPNRLIDEALLMMADTMHPGSTH